jgi:hypothetical protein
MSNTEGNAMAKKITTWKTGSLDVAKILLDVKNPRIEVSDDAPQDELRLRLLEFEGVLELARDIEKNGGLFYGERIITVIDDGSHVVLEGNRRVAACQMLLDPSLVPSAYRLRFPKASPNTVNSLSQLSADIAPDRETAEPILTKRHTERGVKPWSPVAKMRRAVRLLDKLSVEEVAQLLGTTPTQVKRLIRPYRLLKYAINMKGWTTGEQRALEDEKLTTNPYTRLFTLKKTKEILQVHFDIDENIVSALPAKVFKEQMRRVVRDFLIPDPTTGGTRCDSRTDPVEYFSAFTNSPDGKPPIPGPAAPPASTVKSRDKPAASDSPQVGGASANVPPASSPAAGNGGTRPKTPKASIFFENLECHVHDNNLIKLTNEIKVINHNRMTIAASLLTRAIFECALVYKLKSARRWGELIKAEGKDPGLAEVIKFCGNFDNGIFAEQNICKTLKSHTTIQAKTYLDAMTHLKYQEADARTLESVANNLRQVIQYILLGN